MLDKNVCLEAVGLTRWHLGWILVMPSYHRKEMATTDSNNVISSGRFGSHGISGPLGLELADRYE